MPHYIRFRSVEIWHNILHILSLSHTTRSSIRTSNLCHVMYEYQIQMTGISLVLGSSISFQTFCAYLTRHLSGCDKI